MAIVNTSTTITINSTRYYHQFKIIYENLVNNSFPYLFIVALVGLITNTSTIILLSKNNVTKNLKIKWALIALALSDLLFNIALLIRGMHDVINGRSDHLCIILSFVSHLAELLSACYTVSFTIQRYCAVQYPFEAAVHRRSSPIITLLLIFLSSSIFSFLLSNQNPYKDCHPELDLSWFIADALCSFVIPFSLIVIFNILIISCIRQHSRSPVNVQAIVRRRRKTIFSQTTHANGHIPNEKTLVVQMKHQLTIPLTFDHVHCQVLSKQRSLNSTNQSPDNDLMATLSTRTLQSIRVTRMLVLVSTSFLILNAPAHLCVIALKIYIRMNASLPTNYVLIDPIQSTNMFTTDNELIVNRTNDEIIFSSSSSLLQHEAISEDQLTIHVLYLAVFITQSIRYASYSMNFFLYSFSGIAFRTSLRQLIRKFQRH